LGRRLLIYGATGFTGRLVAERARAMGLDVVLAGRDPARLRALAGPLDLPWRAAALDDSAALDAALAGMRAVLHVAGPYAETARPMLDACLRSRVHYLDLSGELPVYLDIAGADAAARQAGVMLLPGVGFVVAASDCLAAHLAARMPGARRLSIALSRPDLFSRGTVRAMFGLVREGVSIRRDGRLTAVRVGRLERPFDFGAGPSLSTAVSWADVLTAHRTTGIPDITVYAEADGLARLAYQSGAWLSLPLRSALARRLLARQARLWPEGPSAHRRGAARRVIVAELEDAWQQRISARLHTPDGYDLTPPIALAIARRVLAGEHRPGLQTPAGLFGPGLVLALDGVGLEDVPAGPRRSLDPSGAT
jgi:saccharopine dehydrogenase (NAD+, L-lysine-forming)